MVDNFEQIRNLLEFRSEDDFYFLQILQRKKENPDLSKSVKFINAYYIDSFDKFDRYKDRIIQECDLHKARAYFNLNRRSYRKVSLECIRETARLISEENYKSIRNIWNTACGRTINETNKKWIIDINTKDILIVNQTLIFINATEPQGDKFIDTIPTKQGYHLIVSPFTSKVFNEKTKNIDYIDENTIHKNNPTILYIP